MYMYMYYTNVKVMILHFAKEISFINRMVILIVSSHFIKSKWCRLEVELPKMECLERGRNIVVTVLLEPIQERLKGLEWFMKRYTYLEWFTCDTMRFSDSNDYKLWSSFWLYLLIIYFFTVKKMNFGRG